MLETRKKQVVAVTLAVAAGAGLAALGGKKDAQAEAGFMPARLYDVRLGDSLWRIANKAYPQVKNPSTLVEKMASGLPDRDYAHAGRTLQPVDEAILPIDAKIGRKVRIARSLRGKLPLVVAPPEAYDAKKGEESPVQIIRTSKGTVIIKDYSDLRDMKN